MAKVLVRNLHEHVISKLKRRARRNERSLQAELQTILERAAATDIADFRSLAARIREKLGGRRHSDSTTLIAADRRR
jgi:plasmid stability protein